MTMGYQCVESVIVGVVIVSLFGQNQCYSQQRTTDEHDMLLAQLRSILLNRNDEMMLKTYDQMDYNRRGSVSLNHLDSDYRTKSIHGFNSARHEQSSSEAWELNGIHR
ncbi:unnamed protein product [Didymodactylos carnosus]|uniref:Uncharacterized protein n=1 Tax=Didymodactylos carnosus TaxID=1234261 RepID=A0A8S2PIN8_9BILA|nr:unnamed protein product [Didymodactylos carnosus]CAF4053719.1 unnamed protein product [Didymodactylos carnosus]